MKSVIMYFKRGCPFCSRAEMLLKQRGVDQIEKINIVAEPEKRAEMIARSNGQTTVPQIFINDQHIGGCSELYALDQEGKLAPLLAD